MLRAVFSNITVSSMEPFRPSSISITTVEALSPFQLEGLSVCASSAPKVICNVS